MVSILMSLFMGKLRGKVYLKINLQKDFPLCMLPIRPIRKNNSTAKGSISWRFKMRINCLTKSWKGYKKSKTRNSLSMWFTI